LKPGSEGHVRQLPVLEPETAFFWTSGAEGRLLICRCDACARYTPPADAAMPDVRPVIVSPRHRSPGKPGWPPSPSPAAVGAGLSVPFVFAAVELVEQRELYVLTNIVGCPSMTSGSA